MNLEKWLYDLLDSIVAADNLNASFEVRLEAKTVHQVAEAWNRADSLTITEDKT